jgi:pyruvate formate lyase activating enzyme
MTKAAYWRPDASGSIRCELCPHGCRIAEGRTGLCKARSNKGGSMSLPYYGLVSSLGVDPIEKKPLFHFLPGSAVFSVGFVGCNMRCPFCQNWQISQEIPEPLERFSPETLVKAALRSGTPSIAYTYSEPTVHFEFVLASMAAARQAGLRNVLVTNGCLESGPARELLQLTDAVNVDLKTWSEEGYERVLGGRRDTVLEFIRIAASLSHVEATTLVVPGLSDSIEGMRGISGFLAGLSKDIALHLSAYHPDWKYDAPSTRHGVLDELAACARGQLHYVYLGNIQGEASDTLCPGCGATVISRRGYRVESKALAASGSVGRCSACGIDLHIIV